MHFQHSTCSVKHPIRDLYIISWVYLSKIQACNIPTKNRYNAEESVIILNHLYRVSASVYPKIPVGAAHNLAFNLLDHNVVVWVHLTSIDKVWLYKTLYHKLTMLNILRQPCSILWKDRICIPQLISTCLTCVVRFGAAESSRTLK